MKPDMPSGVGQHNIADRPPASHLRPPQSPFHALTTFNLTDKLPPARQPHPHLSMTSPVLSTHRSSLSVLLPPEILSHALSFAPLPTLQQCAAVNRRWHPKACRVMACHRQTAEGHLKSGQALMQRTLSPEGCLQLFQRALQLYPGLTEASYWLAKVLLILKTDKEAELCLTHALRQRPSPVDEIKLRACLLYTKNDDLHASQLLERALELAPDDACLHFELGFCYHGMQEFVKAITSYTQALQLRYHRVFVLLANRANCLHWCGRLDEALRDLQQSLAISPHYELALRTRAHVYMDVGHLDAASEDFTSILQQCPNQDPRPLSNAYFHRALCRIPTDEADLTAAQRADPTNLDPVQHHTILLAQQHRIPEAVACLTAWIDANPESPDLVDQYVFRAELHEKEPNLDAAVADYERALGCFPSTGSPVVAEACRVRIQTLDALRGAPR